jgi:hypothetical protein
MKVNITGASHFVNRMFEACGTYQWAREFLVNSIEANATRVEFGIEWQGVEKHGIYRRTISDNGDGMTGEELIRFFSILGAGGKKIGGIHENFGVGAKIASLPWNPEGVVVISYKNRRAAMIWIVLDPDSGEYELIEFDVNGQKTCAPMPSVIAGIDWNAARPAWLREHGTVVVLMGSERQPDTVLGNPDAAESDIKGLSLYLNSRFWDLSRCDVRVAELRSERKSLWPQKAGERNDSRRPNNRKILGACYFLTEFKAARGKLKNSGTLPIDGDRVSADWYLWEGERPAIHSYAKKAGYIGIFYKGELFQVTSNKAHFRWFGISESAVQQNLTLIIQPQLYEPSQRPWGIYPDQSRNRLLFTGSGDKGTGIPLSEWGMKFAENMPAPILEAIRRARRGIAGYLDDENYRKRLQDKFGSRWKMKVLVQDCRDSHETGTGKLTEESRKIYERSNYQGTGSLHKRRKAARIVQLRFQAVPGGEDLVLEAETPVDVPRFRMAHSDEFDQPWHFAAWLPNDPEGPTVIINIDSPILEEVITYHQKEYPDIYAEEVAKIVCRVFGEVAACKIAHSQKLTRLITEEEINRDYRNEQALTLALMGLIAEESLIGQRLSSLGIRRTEPQLLQNTAERSRALKTPA